MRTPQGFADRLWRYAHVFGHELLLTQLTMQAKGAYLAGGPVAEDGVPKKGGGAVGFLAMGSA